MNRRRDARRAFVEFLLIVAGVLAALAVDEWRTGIGDRARERGYLARLERDLMLDLDGLPDESFDELRVARLDSLLWMNEILSRGGDPPGGVADLVARASQTGWYISPANSVTFDELRSTGSFGLIRDEGLRDEIARYYQQSQIRRDLVLVRISDFPRVSYDLVPRGPGGDLSAGELDDSDHERVSATVASEAFRGVVNHERNAALNRAQINATLRRLAEELLGQLRTYMATLGGASI